MKVLISRPDKIGDVILALHGAKQLKTYLPSAQIYMHVSDYTKPLVDNIKFIDGVVPLNADLNSYEFDAVVDLMAKPKTAKMYLTPKIDIKIGNAARWFSFLYNRSRSIRRSKAILNEAEYNWQLINLADPNLKYSPLQNSLALEDFKNINPYSEFSNFVVLMPSVTVSAYGWALENWINLSKLLNKNNTRVIFLLGPAETALETEIAKQIATQPLSAIRKFGDFPSLIGFLKTAKSYVGTSTGITHLASAVGLPGVALYPEKQSMHPRRWMPYQTKMQVISLDRNPQVTDIFQVLLEDQTPEQLDPCQRAKVSAFIICLNEEQNIRRALESVKWCDEIVVVDSGSTDQTLKIAREYTDKIFFRAWTNFYEQKQFAQDQCQHNWILNIDCDEEVSMELKGQIINILTNPDEKASGFMVSRLIYYLNRWWDKGGWYPEYRLRFYRKALAHWGAKHPNNKALVHERVILTGEIKKLNGHLYHYTYRNVRHQIEMLQKYAQLAAQAMHADQRPVHIYNFILNPFFRFFKFYVLKLGFREGFAGLLVAILESYYTYLKYVLLWEMRKES